MTAVELLALIVLYGGVLAIPMAVAAALAATFGVRHPVLVAGSALGGLAWHGALVYWTYYFVAGRGEYVAGALLVVELATLAFLVLRRHAVVAALVRLWIPAAAVLTSTAFVLGFGLFQGGEQQPVQAAASRFLAQLPIDNAVPLIVADAVENDLRPLPDPLYAGWSAADRPPLQAGLYLAVDPLMAGDPHDRHYAVIATVLQNLWLFGAYVLLAAAGARRSLAATVGAAILVSGFALVNSLFVWPKLLSAAFLLILVAAALTRPTTEIVAARGSGIVLGACAGGAVLAHTGAMIALLALLPVVIWRRVLPPWRTLLAFALTALLLVAPWTLYQRFGNPPGDRLLRLNVAGIPFDDTRKPLLDAILDHYRQIGVRQTLENKAYNLAEPLRGVGATTLDVLQVGASYVAPGSVDATERGSAILEIREQQFFRILPTLGILALGPLLLAARSLLRRLLRQRVEAHDPHEFESTLWIYLFSILVVWSLLMFGPSMTIIHAGTYVTVVLAFIACLFAWWRLSPPATITLVAVQCAATLYLYKDPPPGPGIALFEGGDSLSLAALGAAGGAATIALLAQMPTDWGTGTNVTDGAHERSRARARSVR